MPVELGLTAKVGAGDGMDRAAAALAEERSRGFWVGGALAVVLAVMSYCSRFLAEFFNLHLLGRATLEPLGWWLYVAVRVPVAAALVWTVVRFPGAVKTRAGGDGGNIRDARFFDPLMGLRAMACLIVMVGHFFLVTFSLYPNDPNRSLRMLKMLLLCPPWAGVWVFFTLSGYLMGKGFARGRYALNAAGARSFLRNRLLRIAPVYYVGVFLVSVYLCPEIFRWRNWWMLIEMGLFDYRGDLPLNPIRALWSVSTEMQFYMLVPLLMVGLFAVGRHLLCCRWGCWLWGRRLGFGWRRCGSTWGRICMRRC
jgi:hypothetical protein